MLLFTAQAWIHYHPRMSTFDTVIWMHGGGGDGGGSSGGGGHHHGGGYSGNGYSDNGGGGGGPSPARSIWILLGVIVLAIILYLSLK